MKPKIPAYEELKELSTKNQIFQSILTLLHWDAETYMPEGGSAPRAKQIAELSSLVHEQRISPAFKKCLERLVHLSSGSVKVKHLSREQKVNLREWHRDFIKLTKLPVEFVKTFSQVTSEASQIWRIAKKESNFQLFAPFLEKIVGLCREKAKILGYEEHPYDALVEGYEPCMTTTKLSALFSRLKNELVPLVRKIQKQKQPDDRFLKKAVADSVQQKMGKLLLSKLPLDPHYSRLDLSAHPFSLALHPHDSRITTRILPHGFMSNIFSILHEAGHSLYEMGLPVSRFGEPICEAASLSIHESQSRLWETIVGRSMPFWKFFYPLLQKEVPDVLKGVPLQKFYSAIHKVEPSCIRVEADEVTYCLHVILRFEIEKELIQGSLEVDDLPEAWNAKMKELLGITPPDAAHGCLQDIHWSLGDLGYFPTYALGNMIAAQFFNAFARQHPNWEAQVEKGQFEPLRGWLKENVHVWGKTYYTDQLVKKVTGEPFSEKAYCLYLKGKYT